MAKTLQEILAPEIIQRVVRRINPDVMRPLRWVFDYNARPPSRKQRRRMRERLEAIS
jgi:hypothetical protein